MDANAETLLLAQYVDGFCRAFQKEEVALENIRAALKKQNEEGANYLDGADMGSFAASGVVRLEEEVRVSLKIMEELLGDLLPEETLRICYKPLMRLSPEDKLLSVLERDLKTLSERKEALEELKRELLSRNPKEISEQLPQRVRENIARIIEKELDGLQN